MTPELQLLLACAQMTFHPSESGVIRDILAGPLDWTLFTRKALDHGLVGIAGRALSRLASDLVPADLLEAFRVRTTQTEARNRALFSELTKLLDALEKRGIKAIPLRGAILAAQVYGDLALREFRGPEFLVGDSDRSRAIKALTELGYERQQVLTEAQLDATHRLLGREPMFHRITGTVIEPHTRLISRNTALDLEHTNFWRRAERKLVNGYKIWTLSPEDHLILLASYGGTELWRRVIWVCDIAALITSEPKLDWDLVLQRARRQGCLRMVLLAAMLAKTYFAADVPLFVTEAAGADPTLRTMLPRIAERWIAAETFGPPNAKEISRELLSLHDGNSARARYALRTWFLPKPEHIALLPLPSSLNFLYVPLKLIYDGLWRPCASLYAALSGQAGRLGKTLRQSDFAVALQASPEKREKIKHDRALAVAARALKRDPQNIEARYRFALSLRELRQFDDAIEAFRAVLTLEPNHIGSLYNLGLLMLTKNRNADSRVLFEHVLAISPEHGDALSALGIVLLELGEHREAEAVYRQLITLRPNRGEPLAGLAKVLIETGDLGQARACLAKAMTLSPDKPDILYTLVNTGKVQMGDPVIVNLEGLIQRETTLSSGSREYLRFALAKAYDDIGERERGFRHLLEGNAIRRSRIQYDEVKQVGELERIRELFGPELFTPVRASDDDSSPVPVFILGMPRSGSTLIEQILASHPKVFAAGERPEMMHAAERFLKLDTARHDRAGSLSPQLLRDLGANYMSAMRRLAPPEASRIVDKLLQNFRYVGLIHLALPNARIVHSVRDPIDTCLSCFSNRFSLEQMQFAYDLGELGRFYRAYERLMAYWRNVLPPGVMLDVKYESLVRNFETTARDLVQHCGLEWNDACLAFHETKRTVNTLSRVQVRQPLYQSSVGRWRPDTTLLQPLLVGLGLPETKLTGKSPENS